MSIAGNWVLHFSWGCTNNYSQENITFNSNGTFTGPGTGKWRQREGTVLLAFDGGPARYGGTVNGNVGSGAMSTFAGMNGCWYLVKQGTAGLQPATGATAQSYDASGNQL